MGLGGYDAEESEIRFTISATDLDIPTQPLIFTITPLPPGASFTPSRTPLPPEATVPLPLASLCRRQPRIKMAPAIRSPSP